MKYVIELNPNNQNIVSFLLHATCSCRNLWNFEPTEVLGQPILQIRVDNTSTVRCTYTIP